ncbi:MAG: hypothetical protein AAGU74_07355 [Bacillota bacterium]
MQKSVWLNGFQLAPCVQVKADDAVPFAAEFKDCKAIPNTTGIQRRHGFTPLRSRAEAAQRPARKLKCAVACMTALFFSHGSTLLPAIWMIVV